MKSSLQFKLNNILYQLSSVIEKIQFYKVFLVLIFVYSLFYCPFMKDFVLFFRKVSVILFKKFHRSSRELFRT